MNEIRSVLASAVERLAGDSAALDAQVLLLHVLQRPRAWLYAHADDSIDASDELVFAGLVARRAAGEPVAYLIGRREFWSLDLKVTPATLIPRTDTELLVELALERIPDAAPADVADLGTGSGAIALAIARERPGARVVATDVSSAALVVARENADANDIANVEFVLGDWCAALNSRRFDLIAANPPYIAQDDPHLSAPDLRHEPLSALASGADGLDDIRRIVIDAVAHLHDDGWLLLEHGYDQGERVRHLLTDRGFSDVETWKDIEQRERVSGGRWQVRANVKGVSA